MSPSAPETAPPDDWAESAAGWDSDPYVNAYAEAAFASLLEAVPLGPTARVLDFGCGTGLLTERVAPLVGEVVAVDASPAMVAVLRAKGLPGVRCGVARWTAANIDEDPLAEGVFDVVLCSSVCAFLPDYPGTVALLAQRLAPGGVFVQWDWERDPSAEEPSGLSRDQIHAALTGAGLDVESLGIGFEATVEGMTMRPLMGVGRRLP